MTYGEKIIDLLERQSMSQEEALKSISISMNRMMSNGVNLSQSAANDLRNGGGFADQSRWRSSNQSADKWKPSRKSNTVPFPGSDNIKFNSNFGKGFMDQFTDAIEDQFWKALSGNPITSALDASIANFANSLGSSVDDLGKTLGDMVGNSLSDAVKRTKLGNDVSLKLTALKGDIGNQINSIINQASSNIQASGKDGGFNLNDLFGKTGEGSEELLSMTDLFGKAKSGVGSFVNEIKTNGLSSAMSTASESILGSMGNLGPLVGDLGTTIGQAAIELGPYALAVAGAVVAIKMLSNAVGPAIEGFKSFAQGISQAANRTSASEKKNTELAKKRLEADSNTLIETAYNVIEESADKVVDAFQSALSVITASQGYTKSDVQDLMSNYAQRLRDNGLSSVVSAADITTNLEKVLEAGLSGSVAEEFAYIATVLNEAVPTEDFFNYASTYASIAANAIAQGKSQSEAISYANSELESFASNVLYASRELAGGFSTGLTNAASLLEDSVKIANSSRTGDASVISSVLTSVSAIVGAVAPDLASELVNSVVSAALGGNNNSSLTALRSLAGTGASNTSFLTALASDPQAVFSELFNNLAELQKMSSDNFMEVAEGLSSIFGISTDAFARVDFNYLADAISQMNINNSSLSENMALLRSGESTTSAEQLRMEKINEYMIDEGLSYVLDNEAARAIQQHMWDEQLARDLQETEYAVNLQGSALDLLSGISQTVDNIISFLNPFKKLANIAATAAEAAAIDADIVTLLYAGQVGAGNANSMYNLTHSKKDLELTGNYTQLLTGASAYDSAHSRTAGIQSVFSPMESGKVSGITSFLLSELNHISGAGAATSGPTSQYTWGMVSKSSMQSSGYSGSYNSGSAYEALPTSAFGTASEAMQAASQSNLNKYLGSIEDYVRNNEGATYEDWLKNAKDYGISDAAAAFEEGGVSEEDIKSQFTDVQAAMVNEEEQRRKEIEEQFWNTSIAWYTETFPAYQEELFRIIQEDLFKILQEEMTPAIQAIDTTLVSTIHAEDLIGKNGIIPKMTKFMQDWTDYYINHITYKSSYTSDYLNAVSLASADKDATAIQLQEALLAGVTSLSDPTAQTNVLLAGILQVVQAIMQQTNTTTTVSLPTALSSLGLGVTST